MQWRPASETGVVIEAQAGAYLEYLPDPLILFRDSRLHSRLKIRLHQDATVLACDSMVPHDPRGEGDISTGSRPSFAWKIPKGCFWRVIAIGSMGTRLSRNVPGITGSWRCQGGFIVLTRCVSAAQIHRIVACCYAG
jgi:hypothetical protein